MYKGYISWYVAYIIILNLKYIDQFAIINIIQLNGIAT